MLPPFVRHASKYRNKPTEYGGRRYASKAEAGRARVLDYLKAAGQIRGWEPQVRFSLGDSINRYVVDFLVVRPDGTCHAEDVKGARTPKFVRDVKLWRKYGLMPLHIISGKKLEIVEPEGRGGP